MSLGKHILALREKYGWNQQQVAEASRISQATISRIERGQVTQLKSEALKRLADALGVTMNYLVDPTERLFSATVSDVSATMHYIAHVYHTLSPARRDQLRSFVQFLEAQESREGMNERKREAGETTTDGG